MRSKSINSIHSDLTASLWVTDLIEIYYSEKEDEKENIYIATDNKDTVSTLELSRSSISIKYNFEEKNLNKIFNIKINVKDWKIELNTKIISKKDLYSFLIENWKKKNYNTRGWKSEKFGILYGFLRNYVDSNAIGSTLYEEIMKAKSVDEDEKNPIQKEFIKYEKNTINLKETIRKLNTKLNENANEQIQGVKWGLFKIWKDNTAPLLDIETINKLDYPFLIASSVIRSTMELLATFVISESKTLRSKMIQIWEKLSSEELKEFKIENDDKPITHFLRENYIKEEIKKFNNRKLFEILKKYIVKNKLNSTEIFKILCNERNLDKNDSNYKILKNHVGYIDNFLRGENHSITNTIIHAYYYLENENNHLPAWSSLNSQLEILNNIIEAWIMRYLKK